VVAVVLVVLVVMLARRQAGSGHYGHTQDYTMLVAAQVLAQQEVHTQAVKVVAVLVDGGQEYQCLKQLAHRELMV
jgi:hypothetical protein